MVHFVGLYYAIILQFSVQKENIKYIEIVVSDLKVIYKGRVKIYRIWVSFQV